MSTAASRTRRHGTRASASISTASLLLRIAVGVTFIWAGLGKVLGTMTVSGEQAAILAGMGAATGTPPSAPSPSDIAPLPNPKPEPTPEIKPEPTKPEPAPEPKPEVKPDPKPEPAPAPKPSTPAPTPPPPAPTPEPKPAPTPEPTPAPVEPEKPTEPATPSSGTISQSTEDAWIDPTTPRILLVQSSATTPTPNADNGPHIYTAADFPHPVKVTQVWGLALAIKAAAEPKTNADGTTSIPLWPPALAEGSWPKRLAYAVAITELAGGLCVLLGLITRLWSFALAGVMLGAMWLTQVGPIVRDWSGVSGIFAAKAWDDAAWSTLWLQMALLGMSLAILLIGPGRVSLDAALFGGGQTDDDTDDL